MTSTPAKKNSDNLCGKTLLRALKTLGLPAVNTLLSVSCSAKFDTCTVVGLNGTLVELKKFKFILEYLHFIFIKCPILTHDAANGLQCTNTKSCITPSAPGHLQCTIKEGKLALSYATPLTYKGLAKQQPQFRYKLFCP
jgi:hypothetical protein